MDHLPDEHDVAASYATYLLLAESGIGGILHATHFPIAGNILSLNQVFLITRAVHLCPSKISLPCTISTIAGLLKSLCPIGKKLFPMLVIIIQGALYTLGLLLFGNTLAGRIVGATLLSLWGFIQPLLVYYLIFDTPLYQAVVHVLHQLEPLFNLPFHTVITLLACLVVLKVVIAIGIVIVTPYIPQSKFEYYVATISKKISTIESAQPKATLTIIARKAGRDLLSPWFLLCLGVTASFLYFVEASPHWFLLGIVRPAAAGFVCFFLFRWIPVDNWVAFLQRKKNGLCSKTFKRVLDNIRGV